MLKAVAVALVVMSTGSDGVLVHVGATLAIDAAFHLHFGEKRMKIGMKGLIGAGILRGHWSVLCGPIRAGHL